jgi:hypothetical protein
MNFELGIGIGKNLENGIYEFREWIGVGKIPRKWNSWISNLEWYVNDLTSKWYVMDFTSHSYWSTETHFEPMARNRDLWFLILELQNLEFWFWNFTFGIQMSEIVPAKHDTNSWGLLLSLAYQQANNSMTSSLAITQ